MGNFSGRPRSGTDPARFPPIRSVIRRYWDADGPSHSRALAYYSIVALHSGLIGFIGLASLLDVAAVRGTVQEWLVQLSPGPSGRILGTAVGQTTAGGAAAVLGLGAALFVGTRAMAQFQRASDRLWGIAEDPPAVRRYLVGFALAVSAGLLLALGAVVLAGGETIATGAGWGDDLRALWRVVRWPFGVLLAVAAVTVLYRMAPRARPSARALLMGAAVAIVLWIGFTALLSLYFSVSDRLMQSFGPLAGIVALALWAAFTAVALHLGVAVTAEASTTRPPSVGTASA